MKFKFKTNIINFDFSYFHFQISIRMQVPNQQNTQPIIISAGGLGGQGQTFLQMAPTQTTAGVYLTPTTTDD